MKPLILTCALFLALPAAAQRTITTQAPPPIPTSVFGHKPADLYPLLAVPQIQKEIALTLAQTEKLEARQAEMEEIEEPKDADGSPRELTEEELPRAEAKIAALREKAVVEVLTARQRTRLDQVLAHMQGASALMRKRVLESLEVSEAQQKSMLEAQKTAVEELNALREALSARNLTDFDRNNRAAKYHALRESIPDRMVAVLTPQQQQRWRDLIGPKFKLQISRPPAVPGSGPQPPSRP